MSHYPVDVYVSSPQHHEAIHMDSLTGGTGNYVNSGMHGDGFMDGNQGYGGRGESWEEGTDGSHRHTGNYDPDDIDNELPSRQKSSSAKKLGGIWRQKTQKAKNKSHATIRLRNGEAIDVDEIAETFVNNELDNVDAPPALQATTEEIRGLTTSMSIKKAVRDKVERSRKNKRKEHPPNCFVQLAYSMAVSWKHVQGRMAELLYSLELWKASLKTIEGKFGTGVTSYFRFLKWLFLFNIPTFLVIVLFVVVPQLFWRIKGNHSAVYIANNATFTGIELLTGGNWFKQTELYYGSYTNYTVNVIAGTHYNMRFAYLFTVAGFYLVTLLILAYSLAKSYKTHFIDGSQSNRLYYVSKVLCGWDYMVMKEKTGELHFKAFYMELLEYLAEFHKVKHRKKCGAWCQLMLLRLAIHIAVVAVIAGFGYLVWFIAPLTRSVSIDDSALNDFVTPLLISAINLIVPFAFSFLASIENYHNPWVDVFLTMLRTITLNFVTLGALMYFWFTSEISCHSVSLSVTNSTDTTTPETTNSDKDCIPCWENFLGQQFYCLVLVDFILIVLATFCSEFLRRILAAYMKISTPEFNIGRNTLNLIYSQSLVWLGVFYCPLLPCLMILKLFILFYIKKVSVVYNCQPSKRSWRGGSTYTLILLLLFTAFLLCFCAVSYSILFMPSSQECGPFIGFDTSYSVISDAVEGWKERNNSGFIKGLVEVLTSAAFYITLFIIVCAIAYYTRLVSNGHKEVVERLRRQIQMEGKDKNFLKKVAAHVRKGAKLRGPHQRESSPQVETLKPQHNAGVTTAGLGENNNDRSESYVSPARTQPSSTRSNNSSAYLRPSQQPNSPVDATNPGYREHSPTTVPSLPYFSGQQYPAAL